MNYSSENMYQMTGENISGIRPEHDVLPNVSDNVVFCLKFSMSENMTCSEMFHSHRFMSKNIMFPKTLGNTSCSGWIPLIFKPVIWYMFSDE